MSANNWYFFDLLDRYNIVFNSLFKDIYIKRLNKSTDEYDLILRVPIHSENRTKRYMYELNKNLESVGAKLPIIGISDPDVNLFNDTRRPPLKGLNIINKEDSEIINRLPSPIPIELVFDVSVWCEYNHDMNQITEQIIGNFSEVIVKPVNIIQDMAVYLEVPILMGDVIENKSKFESLIIDNLDHVRRKSFLFTLYGYIFKPIESLKLLKRTIYRGDEFKIISEIANSPNDLMEDDKNNTFSMINETLFNIYEYYFDEEREMITFIEDISSYIALHGEKFEFKNLITGDILPYVFEYSNGEWYSNDNSIPSYLTGITKTGNVAFYVKNKIDVGTLKISLVGIDFDSYYLANDVFYIYNDFNKRHFESLNMVNKTPANYAYISQGALITLMFTKDNIQDAVKILPMRAITERLKEFVCSYTQYVADETNILFGLVDDLNGRYLYLRGDYTLVLNNGSSDLDIFTFNTFTLGTVLTIKYKFTDADIVVSVNDQDYTYTTSFNFTNCFISGCRTLNYADYIYGRRYKP